jgi:hypothetical protein
MMDSYEAVKIATWDFLSVKGEINALNLATLVENMIRIEQGQVLRENETDLFHTKQDLKEFSNFLEDIDKMEKVKTARQLIEYRQKARKRPIPMHESDISAENGFDVASKGLLVVPSGKIKEN